MNIVQIGRKRVAITSLYAKGDHVEISAGVYIRDRTTTRDAWTGESLTGNIPEAALLEFGLKAGFLKWEGERRTPDKMYWR